MEISGFLQANWAVIEQAPWVFVVGGAMCLGIGYAIASRLTSERLQLAEARVADYKEKLAGATPDEAKTTIAELQREVSALKAIQPWRLSTAQVTQLSAAIAENPTGIRIIRDVGSSLLESVQVQLVTIFQNSGWTVHHGASMGKPKEPHATVTLCIPNDGQKTGEQIRGALRAADIEFGEQMPEKNEALPIIWLSSGRP